MATDCIPQVAFQFDRESKLIVARFDCERRLIPSRLSSGC